MFDSLSERLGSTFQKLRGLGRITEDNIKDTLRDVRMALLEADVALPVLRELIDKVKKRAIGQDVLRSLTPGQALVKVVQDELIAVMGQSNAVLELNVQPPAVILMAGLQGAGKTTTTVKLARFLTERDKKSVLVTSTDIYRPAAIEQLKILADETTARFFPSQTDHKPLEIAQSAIDYARLQFIDVVIIDTAGRLHVDDDMMSEIRQIHDAVNPVETLFVADSMTGQDAANTAKAFNDALALTGVILTKADGDARGGAALSIRYITGKPIKFMGVGEKTDALEPFHPDRVVSRLLGMGDVLSLVEEAERKIDKGSAKQLADKLKQGDRFDLDDFKQQISQMNNMGGVSAMLDKLPGMGHIPVAAKQQISNKELNKLMAMIDSMTKKERRRPDIIKGSRKKRIAMGSGTQIQDVNRLLKQFAQMQKMMKKMGKKGGLANMMRGLGGQMPMGGKLPF